MHTNVCSEYNREWKSICSLPKQICSMDVYTTLHNINSNACKFFIVDVMLVNLVPLEA